MANHLSPIRHQAAVSTPSDPLIRDINPITHCRSLNDQTSRLLQTLEAREKSTQGDQAARLLQELKDLTATREKSVPPPEPPDSFIPPADEESGPDEYSTDHTVESGGHPEGWLLLERRPDWLPGAGGATDDHNRRGGQTADLVINEISHISKRRGILAQSEKREIPLIQPPMGSPLQSSAITTLNDHLASLPLEYSLTEAPITPDTPPVAEGGNSAEKSGHRESSAAPHLTPHALERDNPYRSLKNRATEGDPLPLSALSMPPLPSVDASAPRPMLPRESGAAKVIGEHLAEPGPEHRLSYSFKSWQPGASVQISLPQESHQEALVAQPSNEQVQRALRDHQPGWQYSKPLIVAAQNSDQERGKGFYQPQQEESGDDE